jgi:uncharacterized protein
MSEATRYLIVGLIVLIGNGQQGITGFGSNVLALPFVILLLGLQRAVPLLVTQGLLLAILMVCESRRFIDWREYGRIVLLAVIGLPVGIYAAKVLPEHALRWALVGFMGVVGVQGLAREGSRGQEAGAGTRPPTRSPGPPRWLRCLVPLGGVMQGAFGTGGPLIVVYADRALRDKSVFRATLSMLWLTLNLILVGTFFASGRMDHEQFWLNLLCLPATLAGMWIGTHTHYRMDERIFRLSVYAVLVMAAGVLAWSLVK